MLGWELPPHNSGGLGVACLNIAEALANEGAKIDFLLPFNEDYSNINFMNILPVTDHIHFSQFVNDAYSSSKNSSKNTPGHNDECQIPIRNIQKKYCEYVINYLKNHRPDVVHAHDWLTFEAGIIAKEKFHIPLVAHVHATEFDRAGMHTGNPVIHEIEYKGLVAADRIIVVSNITKRIIHEKYHIPLEKIEVAYNSLDKNYNLTYTLDNDTRHMLENLKKQGFTIVSTVGRFTLQKGMPNLMKAAALAISKNPKLIFIFAGDGEERNKLIEMSAELGISQNVIFTGFIRGRKLRDIYAATDIFVMSSISEPFGLTALEAAHHGDTLILTHQSGVSEIVCSALKYNYWDIKKLAAEILAVSSNPVLKESLQKNLKKEHCSYTWTNLAKKCLKIYSQIVSD